MNKILQKVIVKKAEYEIVKIEDDAKINNRDIDWIVRNSYICGVYAGHKITCIHHVCLYLKIAFGMISCVYAADALKRFVASCCKTQDAGDKKV